VVVVVAVKLRFVVMMALWSVKVVVLWPMVMKMVLEMALTPMVFLDLIVTYMFDSAFFLDILIATCYIARIF
jgi:hypothetical protein